MEAIRVGIKRRLSVIHLSLRDERKPRCSHIESLLSRNINSRADPEKQSNQLWRVAGILSISYAGRGWRRQSNQARA